MHGSPPGSVHSLPLQSPHASGRGRSTGIHEQPSWADQSIASFADGGGLLDRRRGSFGNVSVDGSVASSMFQASPRTPGSAVRGSGMFDGADARHTIATATPEGAEIGQLLPQRPGSQPGSLQQPQVQQPAVVALSAEENELQKQMLAAAAVDLDERLERLRQREAELASLVQSEREAAAEAKTAREERASKEIAQVSFQWKNPDFLLKNPNFLIRNPDFLFKNG